MQLNHKLNRIINGKDSKPAVTGGAWEWLACLHLWRRYLLISDLI